MPEPEGAGDPVGVGSDGTGSDGTGFDGSGNDADGSVGTGKVGRGKVGSARVGSARVGSGSGGSVGKGSGGSVGNGSSGSVGSTVGNGNAGSVTSGSEPAPAAGLPTRASSSRLPVAIPPEARRARMPARPRTGWRPPGAIRRPWELASTGARRGRLRPVAGHPRPVPSPS